jgi:hypothetical protein
LKFIGTPLLFRHPVMIGKQGGDGIHFVSTKGCSILVFIPDGEDYLDDIDGCVHTGCDKVNKEDEELRCRLQVG